MDVVRPAVLIEKTVSLNGQCPGQNSVVVAPGTTVTYCYRVTNTGDTYLSNVVVTDNVLGAICTHPAVGAWRVADLHEDGDDQPGHDERGHGDGAAVGSERHAAARQCRR